MSEPSQGPLSAVRGVLDVARAILDDLDLEVVLERVVESAQTMVGARYAALGVLDPSRTELERFLTAGLDEAARRRIGPAPRGRGVLGELIRRPVPLRLTEVGAHPHSYGFPPGHPEMRALLGVPVVIGGQPYGNLYLCERDDGEPFSEADEAAIVVLAEFAGVAIDHARRYTRLQAEQTELRRRVETLDATVQIARAVGGETNLDIALELVAKRGRALVCARALLIEHQSGDELIVVAGAGELPRGVIGRRVELHGSVAAAALRSRITLRLEDDANRARFERHGAGSSGLHADAGLVVPLVFRGRDFGVLIAIDRQEDGPAFSDDDRLLLEAFAASAATALATAHSVQAERRRLSHQAVERERARWARELDERTLQSLAAVRVALAAQLRVGGSQTIIPVVQDAVARLDAELAALRVLITQLRPPALDELGFEAAIEDLAGRARRDGLQIEISVDLGSAAERDRHGAELETALYRITEDAVNAARRHRSAHRVRIEIAEVGDTVRVTVRDDGEPLDPASFTDGLDLAGMRERSALHGGTIEVQSSSGEGTTLTAALPATHPATTLPAARARDEAG
jgi:signal transduction histidine kinase